MTFYRQTQAKEVRSAVSTKARGRSWSRRTVLTFSVLIVAGTIVGCGASDNAEPAATDPPAATGNVTTTEAPSTTTTAAPATTAAATTPPTTVPGFSDGVFLVGVDVAAGIYESDVPSDDSRTCYWERLNDATGVEVGVATPFEDANIIGGNAFSGEHLIVEIVATDVAFNSYACGVFTPLVALAQPATEFGPGDWLVGSQIAPGHYEATGDPASSACYWRRLSAVTGFSFDVIAYSPFEGAAIADIEATDFAFSSNGCGDWTLVP
ncbi:MAG: hypothetical protein HY826_14505 [Actinobacteria bacterium]|nr:hypothetical protein [Actinomycetota bacterium]